MVAKSSDPGRNRDAMKSAKPVTLKHMANVLGLSPTTISRVLNQSTGFDAIPAETQERVLAVARELNYRPNHLARALRQQRSHSIGVLAPEISDAYAGAIVGGIDARLLEERYFYLLTCHQSRRDLLDEYLSLLAERSVEGLLVVNTPVTRPSKLPMVALPGYRELPGVTNVLIDHDHAVEATFRHLIELGHRRIAFFRGHPDSIDSDDRWRAILEGAEALGLEVRPELTLQLAADPSHKWQGYQEGYSFGQALLAKSTEFTSLFAFDDVSAIGAMRAFQDAGLKVPDDISVVGFDNIQSAAYHNPSLTTVHQPLRKMGEIAAGILLDLLASRSDHPGSVTVEPELIVRDSTGPVSSRRRASG